MKTWAKFCDIDKFNVKSKSLVAYVAARFFLNEAACESLSGKSFNVISPELDLPRIVKIKKAKLIDAEKQIIEIAVDDIENAEILANLVGKSLLADMEDVKCYGEGSWTEIENKLLGKAVVDKNLGNIGSVTGISGTQAQMHLLVDGPRGEILIPYVPQLIVSEETNKIETNLPDGLIDINEE